MDHHRRQILDYVAREMADPGRGFYCIQDADSKGEQGKFFAWTPDEARKVLDDDADQFMTAYGITPSGNVEGKNILEFVATWTNALPWTRHIASSSGHAGSAYTLPVTRRCSPPGMA